MIATPVATTYYQKRDGTVSRLRRLAIEVCKALKSLNPDFHVHLFQERFTL